VVGAVGRRGPPPAAGASAPPADLFDGIEHGWKRLPGGAAIDAILSQAISANSIGKHPDRTIPLLAKARPLRRGHLRPAGQDQASPIWMKPSPVRGHLGPTPRPERATSLPARTSPCYDRRLARQPVAMRRPSRLFRKTSGPAIPGRAPLAAAGQRIPDYDLQVPAAQPFSQPYWLIKPPQAGAYTVDNQLLNWPARIRRWSRCASA